MNQAAHPTDLDQRTIEAFDQAQRQTIALMRKVVSDLATGQTPEEIAKAARAAAPAFGFSQWFHTPHIRFDAPKEQPKKANVPNFIERNRILAAQKAAKT